MDFTDSTQVPLSDFKSTSPSLRGEVDLKSERGTWVKTTRGALGSQVLRGRACEAEENLTTKCTECSFNPMSMKRVPSTPRPSLRGKVYLAVSELTLGKSLWCSPPLSVRLNVSTPIKCKKNPKDKYEICMICMIICPPQELEWGARSAPIF